MQVEGQQKAGIFWLAEGHLLPGASPLRAA
jgi:hypothetical protein